MTTKGTNNVDTKRIPKRDSKGKFVPKGKEVRVVAVDEVGLMSEEVKPRIAAAVGKGTSVGNPVVAIAEAEAEAAAADITTDPKEEYLEMVQKRDLLLSRLMNDPASKEDIKEYESVCNEMERRFRAFTAQEKTEIIRTIGSRFAR